MYSIAWILYHTCLPSVNHRPWKVWFICHSLQCRHLIPALNAWAARPKYTTACLIVNQSSGHGCDHMSLASQLNVALIRNLRGSLMCLAFFDMICQVFVQLGTGRRLVQELNVLNLARIFCDMFDFAIFALLGNARNLNCVKNCPSKSIFGRNV